jgi:hypothetical protein
MSQMIEWWEETSEKPPVHFRQYGLDPSVVGSCVTGCAPAPPLEEVLLVGEVKVVDLSANARPHVLESRR